MATYTPPPYFPQGSLAPPDKGRYTKFKLAVVSFVIFLVILLAGAIAGIFFLAKRIF